MSEAMIVTLNKETAECLNALGHRSGVAGDIVTEISSGKYRLNVSRERAIDLVSDEFAATGLGPDNEPNARGIMLEDLLDRINRFD